MLITIRSLDSIVPPVLHIVLGIVLQLYELLLRKCRVLDKPKVDKAKKKKRKDLDSEWLNETALLQYLAQQKARVGSAYLDLYNHRERVDEALSGECDFTSVVQKSTNKRVTAPKRRARGGRRGRRGSKGGARKKEPEGNAKCNSVQCLK